MASGQRSHAVAAPQASRRPPPSQSSPAAASPSGMTAPSSLDQHLGGSHRHVEWPRQAYAAGIAGERHGEQAKRNEGLNSEGMRLDVFSGFCLSLPHVLFCSQVSLSVPFSSSPSLSLSISLSRCLEPGQATTTTTSSVSLYSHSIARPLSLCVSLSLLSHHPLRSLFAPRRISSTQGQCEQRIAGRLRTQLSARLHLLRSRRIGCAGCRRCVWPLPGLKKPCQQPSEQPPRSAG